MTEPVKLLLIFVNETDTWHDDAALSRHRPAPAAAAYRRRDGPGRHPGIRAPHAMHHKGLFGIADDRPVTIMAVDDEAKIRAALPQLRDMVREGLMLLLDAELVNGGQ